jgi:1-acyl-sn-glycerol-3-phosphate acyltransferase
VPTNPLNYLWRLALTGVAFAALGLGGFVLSVTAMPLAAAFARDRSGKARLAQAVVHHSFRLYVAALKVVGLIRLEVSGAARLGAMRGSLIVANHPTLLDVALIMALVPRACCVVKDELWRHTLLGRLVRLAGYVSNASEGERFVAECRAVIEAGENLIIFPEGTRSRPGVGFRFQRGFAYVAALGRINVQVITITCEPSTLLKGQPWYRIPERAPQFRVAFGTEVEVAPFLDSRPPAIAVRNLVTHLETYYGERLAHERA